MNRTRKWEFKGICLRYACAAWQWQERGSGGSVKRVMAQAGHKSERRLACNEEAGVGLKGPPVSWLATHHLDRHEEWKVWLQTVVTRPLT